MTEPTGVGARLREAREAQGLGIDDVAQSLKFAPRQIESLEAERFDRLPGPTIARGMVRNYARLLRLDPEPLLQRLGPQAEKAPDPGQIAERFRREVPFSDGGKRSSVLYAAFSIALLALVGALAYEWRQEKAAPEFVAPARERAEPEERAQPAAAATPPAAVVYEATKPEPAPPPPPAAVAAVQKPPAAAPVPEGQRLVVRSSEEAWVEVKDASGRTLIATLVPAGSERSLRGRPPFELIIGNARAVKITYEGKPVDLRPYTKVEVARFTLK